MYEQFTAIGAASQRRTHAKVVAVDEYSFHVAATNTSITALAFKFLVPCTESAIILYGRGLAKHAMTRS